MKDLIIGSHAWFARKGSTVDGSAVAATTLPVFSSTKADWKKIGSIEQWEPQIEENKVTRRAPVTGGGRYEDRVEFLIDSKLTHAFQVQEFGMLEFELLSNAASVASGTGKYTPNSRVDTIEGWLHREAYDQNGNLIDSSDTWVSLSIEPFQFAENLNPHTLMAKVLSNTLNTGTLSNLT